jgi:hypothetical protein
VLALATAFVLPEIAASTAATQVCGVSSGHTVCVWQPDQPLSGPSSILVTKSPNGGSVFMSWIPDGGTEQPLITRIGPSPITKNYGFVWPTQKYLDATGTLRVRYKPSGAPIDVLVTLANGNTTDYQHSPSDWANNMPGTWAGTADPVVAAVGDGPDDRAPSNAVADSIVAADPALFLFLGDVYEQGTFSEYLNHYGSSALDGTAGTLWGRLSSRTQPTLGNHEAALLPAWTDYWHGHPAFGTFIFGGVLFINLNSSSKWNSTSAQYVMVQQALASAPPGVVAFWHIPVISGTKVASGRLPIWKLLANGGGDLVVNGHTHSMTEYRPMNADVQAGGHLVELISGGGGHYLAAAPTGDSRTAWSLGGTSGALYLTLRGAANGGTATSIDWEFRSTSGAALRTGSVAC